MAFFPLTMPFTTGPGTIAVAIAIGSNLPVGEPGLIPFFLGASAAALAIAAMVLVAYSFADRLVAFLGPQQARVVTRLAAFLLLCVGVADRTERDRRFHWLGVSVLVPPG